MTLLLLILIFNIRLSTESVTICNIPLHNTYYKNILPSRVAQHRDATCHTFNDEDFSKQLAKEYSKLVPCDSSKGIYYDEDYRVFIKLKINDSIKEIYITAGGYILSGKQMFEPCHSFLKIIGERIKDPWEH